MEPWTHRTAQINGLRFHYVEAGTGPLVVLLHGFPEFWYAWRQQLPVLAAAGFHAVAPDLRGYNETEKPKGVEHYRIDLLTSDVVRQLPPRVGSVNQWADATDVLERPMLLQRLRATYALG